MRTALKQLFFDAEDLLEEGRMAEAIRAYEKALAEAKKDDSEEFFALTYLGMAYDDWDDKKKAIEYFRRSQLVAEKLYGKQSAVYAIALSNEAMLSANRKQLAEAEPLLDQAAGILRSAGKALVKSDVADFIKANTVEVYSNAGDCKAKLGKLPQAIDFMKEAYKAAKVHLAAAHPRRIQAALELGSLLSCAGRHQEAKAISMDSLDSLDATDVDPMAAFGAVAQAMINTCVMIDSLEEAMVPAQPIRARKGGGRQLVSNVVPLFNGAERTALPAPTLAEGYQLKITLKRVKPPVWRRVVVKANYSLDQLHRLIQDAMGWTDDHLHEFCVGNTRFADPGDGFCVKNERKYELAQLNLKVGSKFTYEYDFGDSWEHVIEVEKILNEEEFAASDIFIAAKGACPPEDCGGPYGFMNLLAALNDPTLDRRKLPEWLTEYDPTEVPDCFPAKKSKTRGQRTKV